jgi:rSAM/selenodomain-associated transferase 2
MNTLAQLSIIIPFAPDDMAWQALLIDLKNLPESAEIILVAGSEESQQQAVHLNRQSKLTVAKASLGRAAQMNAGAAIAKNPCLWFLHADSRIDAACLKAINLFHFEKSQLGYFGLRFLNDGPDRMGINRFGVWFRSRFLRLPFGDQGFVISKTCFNALGQYREDLKAGEDHAFVWRARKNAVPLKYLNASIQTSARKYARHGWGHTTRTHLRETWRQALQFSKQASRP